MGGTYTPNLHLYKPLENEVGWDAKVNSNFDTLDATVPATPVTSVFARTGDVVAGANDYAAVTNLLLGDTWAESIQFDTPNRGLYLQAQNLVSLQSGSGPAIYVSDSSGDNNFQISTGSTIIQTDVTGANLSIKTGKVDMATLTTEVDVPTPATADSSHKAASTAFVKANLAALSAIAASGKWSDLQNGTAALTLANGANGTEFDQTSSALWKWFNTTIATNSTTNGSPILDLSANYWTGSASAEDKWTMQSVLAAGTNGASALTFAHSGSTGSATVNAPAFGVTNSLGGLPPAGSPSGLYNLAGAPMTYNSTGTYSLMVADAVSGAVAGFISYALNLTSAGVFGFSGVPTSVNTKDTGISRVGAAALAIGNGAQGDSSASLALGNLSQTNPTVATSSTTNASPTRVFSANYWTGAASAADTWTISSSLAAGTNGFSTLTFAHAGSTNAGVAGGVAQVSVPRLLISNGGSQPICFYNASGVNGVVLQDYTNTGDMILFKTNAAYQVVMRSTLVLGWSSGTSLGGGGTAPDSAFSRLGAASVALGNGTQGDFTGALKLGTLNNQGGRIVKRVSKAANYTSTAADYVIVFTATATLTLDSAAAVAGTMYRVKLSTSAAGGSVLTISPNNSKTIEGVASETISTLGGSVDLVYDGASNWEVF
jgi:hypothetical protein